MGANPGGCDPQPTRSGRDWTLHDPDLPVLPAPEVIFERLQAAEARIGWLNSQSEQHMARIMTLERQLRLLDMPKVAPIVSREMRMALDGAYQALRILVEDYPLPPP